MLQRHRAHGRECVLFSTQAFPPVFRKTEGSVLYPVKLLTPGIHTLYNDLDLPNPLLREELLKLSRLALNVGSSLPHDLLSS